ncbi:hypothetical protein FPY71_16475 [Aureimonas fodinaquatilis]|uniref:Uncharacterized protein n=1 Tax=Aureimonas fodinaquatilis TaxID=2565783 RepID=A0A5B0DR62_9HYPH|nr:hypothetical protein [Aureimonas fodinaquatilis]KAA0968485.1 hypothetical protein FPY71_16475 [Aureimonas fodinaquatilis]
MHEKQDKVDPESLVGNQHLIVRSGSAARHDACLSKMPCSKISQTNAHSHNGILPIMELPEQSVQKAMNWHIFRPLSKRASETVAWHFMPCFITWTVQAANCFQFEREFFVKGG